MKKKFQKNKQAICDYEKEIESINAKLADLPEEVDMSSNTEYVKVLKNIENLESKIGLLNSGKRKKKQLYRRKTKIFF